MQAFTIPRTPVMLFIAQMAYDFFIQSHSQNKQTHNKTNKKRATAFLHFSMREITSHRGYQV